MKKIFTLSLILFVSFGLAAEGLSTFASMLKAEIPAIYAPIKTRAESEWPGDYEMIVYTINQQTQGVNDCLGYIKDHSLIVSAAMIEWSEADLSDYENPFTCPMDWEMVAYTSKKQIKAQGSY